MTRRQILSSSLGLVALAGCLDSRPGRPSGECSPGSERRTAAPGPLAIQWTREYGAEGGESTRTPNGSPAIKSQALVRAADDGYALAGYQSERGEALDGCLLLADGDGEARWFREYGEETVNTQTPISGGSGSKGSNRAACITRTSDGGYLLVGRQQSAEDRVSVTSWLLKVDGDGAKQWETFLDAPYVKANDVIETTDGNYLVAGRATNADQDPQYTVTEETNPSDLALTLVDRSGSVRWTRTYDGGGNEFDTAWWRLPTVGSPPSGGAPGSASGASSSSRRMARVQRSGARRTSRTSRSSGAT